MVIKKTVPILEYPGNGRVIIDPKKLFAKQKRIPTNCVLTFFNDVVYRLEEQKKLREVFSLAWEGGALPVYVLGRGKNKVAVCFAGMGATFSAIVLETLIALGGRNFICCGGAGVLDGAIEPGKLILPTAALRDEGTSYHYLKKSRYSRPHLDALRAIKSVCRKNKVDFISGKTWTTDGLYRETLLQIKRRRQEGCLCVEMECAAMFAVAQFRKVVFGQMLYAGDDVSGKKWKHRGWSSLNEVRRQLFDLSVEACRALL
jgi:uridine phosphorylase